jgi:hypothetical protein
MPKWLYEYAPMIHRTLDLTNFFVTFRKIVPLEFAASVRAWNRFYGPSMLLMRQASQARISRNCSGFHPYVCVDAVQTDITMYETLIRPHEVNQVPTLLPIGEVSEKLKKAEQKREEKRLRQIANARSNPRGKRKRGDAADGEIIEAVEDTGNKRVKTDDEDEVGSRIETSQSVEMVSLPDTFSPSGEPQPTDPYTSSTKMNIFKAMPEVRGHTSYLTFACLVPAASSEDTTSITDVIVEEVGSHS